MYFQKGIDFSKICCIITIRLVINKQNSEAKMSEDKEQIGFIITGRTAEWFRQMSKDDKRGFSAEFELFVEQEWQRRNPDPQAEPPFIAARKATR